MKRTEEQTLCILNQSTYQNIVKHAFFHNIQSYILPHISNCYSQILQNNLGKRYIEASWNQLSLICFFQFKISTSVGLLHYVINMLLVLRSLFSLVKEIICNGKPLCWSISLNHNFSFHSFKTFFMAIFWFHEKLMQSMHPKPPYLTLISIIDQFATVRWQRNNPLIKKKDLIFINEVTLTNP